MDCVLVAFGEAAKILAWGMGGALLIIAIGLVAKWNS
jgi:hypothetical protein